LNHLAISRQQSLLHHPVNVKKVNEKRKNNFKVIIFSPHASTSGARREATILELKKFEIDFSLLCLIAADYL
jgi:hypothetical protein